MNLIRVFNFVHTCYPFYLITRFKIFFSPQFNSSDGWTRNHGSNPYCGVGDNVFSGICVHKCDMAFGKCSIGVGRELRVECNAEKPRSHQGFLGKALARSLSLCLLIEFLFWLTLLLMEGLLRRRIARIIFRPSSSKLRLVPFQS